MPSFLFLIKNQNCYRIFWCEWAFLRQLEELLQMICLISMHSRLNLFFINRTEQLYQGNQRNSTESKASNFAISHDSAVKRGLFVYVPYRATKNCIRLHRRATHVCKTQNRISNSVVIKNLQIGASLGEHQLTKKRCKMCFLCGMFCLSLRLEHTRHLRVFIIIGAGA